MCAKTNRVISPNLWTVSVALDDQLCMSMVLKAPGRRRRCPRCMTLLMPFRVETMVLHGISSDFLKRQDTKLKDLVRAVACGHPR
jgi:hypothetical protein